MKHSAEPKSEVRGLTSLLLALGSILIAGCVPPLSVKEQDISPDGSLMALPRGVEIVLHDTKEHVPVRTLSAGHEAEVRSVHFNADGTRLVSGDDDGRMVVWDPATGQKVGLLSGHEGAVEHLACRAATPDLASCSKDHSVRLWDVNSGKEVRAFVGHSKAVYYVAFSPEGRFLASASKDKTVRIWEVETGRQIRILQGHEKAVRSAVFDPTGAFLATGGNEGSIKLWDLKSGQELRTMQGESGPVLDLFFTQDGQWLLAQQFVRNALTNRISNPLGIWKVDTGEHVVNDYRQEVRLAPSDWPYRAVVADVMKRVRHLAP